MSSLKLTEQYRSQTILGRQKNGPDLGQLLKRLTSINGKYNNFQIVSCSKYPILRIIFNFSLKFKFSFIDSSKCPYQKVEHMQFEEVFNDYI